VTAPAPACPPGEFERTLSALTGCRLNSPCPCPWPSPLPLPWPWPHPLPCPRRSPAGRSTAGASGLTACTVPCKLAGCCWYRALAKLPPGPARAPPEAALWRTWAECATSVQCGKVAAAAAARREIFAAASSSAAQPTDIIRRTTARPTLTSSRHHTSTASRPAPATVAAPAHARPGCRRDPARRGSPPVVAGSVGRAVSFRHCERSKSAARAGGGASGRSPPTSSRRLSGSSPSSVIGPGGRFSSAPAPGVTAGETAGGWRRSILYRLN